MMHVYWVLLVLCTQIGLPTKLHPWVLPQKQMIQAGRIWLTVAGEGFLPRSSEGIGLGKSLLPWVSVNSSPMARVMLAQIFTIWK